MKPVGLSQTQGRLRHETRPPPAMALRGMDKERMA